MIEPAVQWYLIVGGLFVAIGVFHSVLRRTPISTAIVYLIVGIFIGPLGLDLLRLNLIAQASFFERVSEIVVIVSLFCAGLKLQKPFGHLLWRAPVRLASVSMILSVALVELMTYWCLGFPLGAGVLLGAILAPTDPVLASEVQVRTPKDQDRLRFALTGEAGFNDGTAFPFVMLGLGLLGLHEIGEGGWRWITVDLVWAVGAGLLSGWLIGRAASRGISFCHRHHRNSKILDDFVAIGMIALSYGVAHVFSAYGFLAVFATGLAMRQIKTVSDDDNSTQNIPHEILSFTEQLERVGEALTVIFLGVMVTTHFHWSWDLLLVPVIFLMIRPISVTVGLWRHDLPNSEKAWISWFGIRGIGSIYYLTYAFTHGLEGSLAERMARIVFVTIFASIFIHGISAHPFVRSRAGSR